LPNPASGGAAAWRGLLLAAALLAAAPAGAARYQQVRQGTVFRVGDVLECPGNKEVQAQLDRSGRFQVRRGGARTWESTLNRPADYTDFKLEMLASGQVVIAGQTRTQEVHRVWIPAYFPVAYSVLVLDPNGVLSVRDPYHPEREYWRSGRVFTRLEPMVAFRPGDILQCDASPELQGVLTTDGIFMIFQGKDEVWRTRNVTGVVAERFFLAMGGNGQLVLYGAGTFPDGSTNEGTVSAVWFPDLAGQPVPGSVALLDPRAGLVIRDGKASGQDYWRSTGSKAGIAR